jgi:serine/threonine-protein kinase
VSNQLERLKSAVADRYAVEKELGRGGMAVVYLARDKRYDRAVALKVLRPDLTESLGAERFLREIQIAAQLNHPHVLPLHDSGEANGFLWYTMPFVDGESLRDRLNREQQLPLEDAIQISKEVADGLGYAHGVGVIHRDIKPENILLSGGHATIADFGIARAVTEAAGQKLTETGIAVGTPAYMSPEQGAGSGKLDARSDLYSLGCVLYEMLAGEPPYTGPTAAVIVAKKMSEPTPRISVVRETVPGPVEEAITRTLAKTPADRFATAQQFTAALSVDVKAYERRHRRSALLRRPAIAIVAVVVIAGGTFSTVRYRAASSWRRQPVDPNTVAVLPFRVTANDPEVANLDQGLPDMLFGLLSGDIGPRAANIELLLRKWSDMQARGEFTAEDAPLRLAADLGAGLLISGGIVQAGARLTVNVLLQRVPDGNEVARYTFQMPADSVHLLPSNVVLGLMGGELGEDRERLETFARQDPDAVKAYLAGVRAFRQRDNTEAVQHFARALEIDSTYALAALRLAQVWSVQGKREEEWYSRMRRALERASEYQERLGTRDRAELAYRRVTMRMDTVGAGTSAYSLEVARAWTDAAPDEPLAWVEYALQVRGVWLVPNRAEERRRALERAWRLDSTTPHLVGEQLWNALRDGDRERTVRVGTQFLAVADTADPGDVIIPGFHATSWIIALLRGDSATVQEYRARAERNDPRVATSEVGLALRDAARDLGLPFDDAELVTERASAHLVTRIDTVNHFAWDLSRAGPSGGRFDKTIEGLLGPWGLYTWQEAQRWTMLISWSLLYPQLDGAAAVAADSLRQLLSQEVDAVQRSPITEAANARCHVELYRAAHGDTVGVREVIGRLEPLIRETNMAGVCPALVEALLESYQPAQPGAPALERLDSLLQRGTGWEYPACAAMVAVPRLLRQRGEFERALAAARRRWPGYGLSQQAHVARLKEVGDLSVIVGDTAGAIEAYEELLRLWHDPDDLGRLWTDSVGAALAKIR